MYSSTYPKPGFYVVSWSKYGNTVKDKFFHSDAKQASDNYHNLISNPSYTAKVQGIEMRYLSRDNRLSTMKQFIPE